MYYNNVLFDRKVLNDELMYIYLKSASFFTCTFIFWLQTFTNDTLCCQNFKSLMYKFKKN